MAVLCVDLMAVHVLHFYCCGGGGEVAAGFMVPMNSLK